jgi:hypothetical protein
VKLHLSMKALKIVGKNGLQATTKRAGINLVEYHREGGDNLSMTPSCDESAIRRVFKQTVHNRT